MRYRILTTVLLLFVLCALPCAAQTEDAPPAPAWTLTIETQSGAALMSGPEDDIVALREHIQTHEPAEWTAERIAEFAAAEFEGRVTVQVFRETDITGQGLERMRMPLRRALLRGLLPPVEGLDMEQAAAVLAAAGFQAVSREKWDAMDDAAHLALVAASTRPVIVLDGLAAQHDVTIISRAKQVAGDAD